MVPSCVWLNRSARNCWSSSCAYVKSSCSRPRLCRYCAGGLARQFQQAFCAHPIGPAAGSALRPLVCIRQPGAHPGEGSLLGWLRVVGLRQAPGERTLLLAKGRSVLCSIAQCRTFGLAQRLGSERKSGLVPALKNFFKLFFVSLNIFLRRGSEGVDDAISSKRSRSKVAGPGSRKHQLSVRGFAAGALANQTTEEGTLWPFLGAPGPGQSLQRTSAALTFPCARPTASHR